MEFAKEQQKFLELRRGLFLVRYDSAEGDKNPPRVVLVPEPGQNEDIEIILPPDADQAVLWSPGGSLVVKAGRPGRLQVIVGSVQPEGSIAARVQLIPISNDPDGLAAHDVSAPFDLSEFRILGHVAGLGDVSVGAGEWIAGPTKPARIEGLTIEWPNKPKNLNLRYAVRTPGQRPGMGPMVETGGFAGTRGRALPLVGAILEVAGAGAIGVQLSVEAVFLGSPLMRIVGERVVLSGPTGQEPLVGLRVDIEKSGNAKSRPAERLLSSREKLKTAQKVEMKETVTAARSPDRPSPGALRVFHRKLPAAEP
jgi:hypothetical protein